MQQEVVAQEAVPRRSLWRRIVDYPLIAMVIAVVLYLIAISVAAAIDKLVALPVGDLNFELKFDILAIPLLIIIYEIVIRRLGEHPRDDYRDPHAMRNLIDRPRRRSRNLFARSRRCGGAWSSSS